MIQAKDFQFAAAPLPHGSALVREMTVRERISGLFEVSLELESSEDTDIVEAHVHELLGAPACLRFKVDDTGEATTFWGVVSEIERRPIVKGHPIHRVMMVPRLWFATRIKRSRIFADVSVVEVAEKVLLGLALKPGDDYELRLSESHPKREYVVQYDESDYDFLCRLLEDEGIFYYFEHDEIRDRLILGDRQTAFRALGKHSHVVFSTSDTVGEEHSLVKLSVARQVRQGGTALIDYNWRTPQLPLFSAKSLGGAGISSAHTEHYRDTERGVVVAEMRAQEINAMRLTFTGKTGLRSLRSGDVLQLVDHPIEAFNQKYLIVELVHSVSQWHDTARNTRAQNLSYTNELVAIPETVPFRPARTTKKPKIEGLTYATIDGPSEGTPAPIDDQGRYKVLFPFDLDSTPGTSRTRWIRCAQALTGPGYGIHFPLREGADVVIAYVYGDPDRPMIMGAVPNPVTPSPVVKKNATQSIIRTSSGITLEFEDDA